MPHEVYAFGDSHWRVYFPFTNHGAPGVFHEERGIVTLDTTASELSGATMWGLAHEKSKQGARRRILETIDARDGVENVGLVFGEVDVRYHHSRYFRPDGTLSIPMIYELLTRYKRFIDDDLIASGRVHGHVFVYYGFRYPLGPNTIPFQGDEAAVLALGRMSTMNSLLEVLLPELISLGPYVHRIHPIIPGSKVDAFVSDDGVHLTPETYHAFILPEMDRVFNV